MAGQVDTVCDQFESAWRQGTRPRVEDFLGDITEPNRTVLLRELLHIDWDYRQRAGEEPTVDEYRPRFPEHEVVIRDVAANSGTIVRPSGEQESAAASHGLTATRDFPNEGTDTAEGRKLPKLPGYEILGELGHGGMGVVYQARDVRLKRLVAIKMIRAGAHADAEEISRFRTEAEAIARLQHPHIVQVHAVGEHAGLPFVVLEFVDGGSLHKKINGTPFPSREAARIVEILARAMQAAHDRGIIHRDLKPANVLLSVGQAFQPDPKGKSTKPSSPPKEVTSEIGPPTDIYALGAILYELLTGRPPFKAATPGETMRQVMDEEPVAPRQLNPSIDRDLETIAQ
jgi:serine/threonine protein kinase